MSWKAVQPFVGWRWHHGQGCNYGCSLKYSGPITIAERDCPGSAFAVYCVGHPQPASSNFRTSHLAPPPSTCQTLDPHDSRPLAEMNSTTHQVGWAAEPQGRGTLGLLVSCGATIFLCTYSAVHPNLPALNEPGWKVLRRRIWYMICCIGAPEWFAFMALEELFDVLQTKRQVYTAG
jgi:hypothetical protein